jgi:anti-sigma B factor antagonist
MGSSSRLPLVIHGRSFGQVTADDPGLSVHSPTHGVVVLDGEIDAHTVPRLEEHFASFPTGFDDGLVIDMAAVTFMDSSGLRLLIDLHGRAAEAGVEMVLRSPSRSVARVIEISGVGPMLSVRAD